MVDENHTYYDILEITNSASPQEIRKAYLRMKATYSKNNLALYSLIEQDQSSEIIQEIENAYHVLSDPQRKIDYDRLHGFLTLTQEFSIHESSSSDEELLIAPTTDFSEPPQAQVMEEPVLTTDLDQKISQETEWHGFFIRKIREARQISIEEMVDSTKITKNYLKALEEEDFSKLPAPVYVRGFITQIARKLKLPQEKVVPTYMERYRLSRQEPG